MSQRLHRPSPGAIGRHSTLRASISTLEKSIRPQPSPGGLQQPPSPSARDAFGLGLQLTKEHFRLQNLEKRKNNNNKDNLNKCNNNSSKKNTNNNLPQRLYWVVIVVVTSIWAWPPFPLANQRAEMQMSRSDVTAVKKDPQQKTREEPPSSGDPASVSARV